MSLEWRISDHVEIAIGRSRVECALPARIGYMGGGPWPEKGYGRWFDAWFGFLVFYVNVEYTQDGFAADEADAAEWLHDEGGLGGDDEDSDPTVSFTPYADPAPDPSRSRDAGSVESH